MKQCTILNGQFGLRSKINIPKFTTIGQYFGSEMLGLQYNTQYPNNDDLYYKTVLYGFEVNFINHDNSDSNECSDNSDNNNNNNEKSDSSENDSKNPSDSNDGNHSGNDSDAGNNDKADNNDENGSCKSLYIVFVDLRTCVFFRLQMFGV